MGRYGYVVMMVLVLISLGLNGYLLHRHSRQPSVRDLMQVMGYRWYRVSLPADARPVGLCWIEAGGQKDAAAAAIVNTSSQEKGAWLFISGVDRAELVFTLRMDDGGVFSGQASNRFVDRFSTPSLMPCAEDGCLVLLGQTLVKAARGAISAGEVGEGEIGLVFDYQ